ncbi:MAG TPA: hypothetical protein VH459_04865 [Gaiellales bacterium]
MNTFHDAFLDARRKIEAGADPEEVVPVLLKLAEDQDEIEMAQELYEDELDEDEETER